jgi:hypothetical protein
MMVTRKDYLLAPTQWWCLFGSQGLDDPSLVVDFMWTGRGAEEGVKVHTLLSSCQHVLTCSTF